MNIECCEDDGQILAYDDTRHHIDARETDDYFQRSEETRYLFYQMPPPWPCATMQPVVGAYVCYFLPALSCLIDFILTAWQDDADLGITFQIMNNDTAIS